MATIDPQHIYRVANISSNTNTGTMVVTTVQQKNPSELLYISLAFGFSLATNAWVFFRISGGLFNPAVSIYDPILSWENDIQISILQQ